MNFVSFDFRRHNIEAMKCSQSLPLLLLLVFSTVISTVLSQCPSNLCSCSPNEDQDIIMNCRRNGLTSIPPFNPTTWSFLEVTLHGNDISSIPADAFHTTAGVPLDVKIIILSDNPITSVDDNAFKGLEDTLEDLEIESTAGMTDFPKVNYLPNLKILAMNGLSMSQLPSGVLQGLSSLHTLALDNCRLTSLSASDFTSQANSIKTLSIKQNLFNNIPTDSLKALRELTTLQFGSNQLSGLEANSFNGILKLEELDLTQNRLATVHQNAFSGLEASLKTLTLSNTLYNDNNLKLLRNLLNLENLILNNNKDIRLLPADMFPLMTKLKKLNLNGCGLRSINQDSFKGLQGNVEDLLLAFNEITNIEDFTFQDFSAIITLDLSLNTLQSTLSAHSLRGMEGSLKILDLTQTELRTDNLKAISPLSSLEILKLNDNQITSIPNFIFNSLESLRELDLTKNALSHLTPQALHGMQKSLHLINLRFNQIQTISHCVFEQYTSLQTLYLASNPLHCDCHSRWLKEWLNEYDDTSVTQFRYQCASPPQLKDALLYDVDLDQLVCEDGEQIEECVQYTTVPVTLPPTIPQPTIGITEIIVNVTNITETEIMLKWQVHDSVTSTLIEAMDDSGEQVWSDSVDSLWRNATVDGLLPGTDYTVCVTAYFDLDDDHVQECVNATTAGSALPVGKEPSQLAIIVGSILGVVAFVVLLIVVIIVVRRTSAQAHPYDKHDGSLNGTLPQNRNDLPQMGYNSKRFSKPRSNLTSISSHADLEKKIDGFTPEERDRILKLLTKSTMSVASTGSQRYLDEPRPHRWTGGASNYPTEGDYQEIPVDQYEYIPADQIGKYDYIPADQVKKQNPVDYDNNKTQTLAPELPLHTHPSVHSLNILSTTQPSMNPEPMQPRTNSDPQVATLSVPNSPKSTDPYVSQNEQWI